MEEIWQPLEGQEGFEVSSIGRVRRIPLPDEVVGTIVRRYFEGERPIDLAREFNVSKWAIFKWIKGTRKPRIRRNVLYSR
jgi:hypothetical protein